jgi:hypothetical protein
MAERITKRAADALRAEGRDAFLWDGEIRGLGLRCRPGGSKTYFLKVRIGNRQRWLTIGRHGAPWTAETARKEALRLLSEVASGVDPAAMREQRKDDPTVAEFAVRYDAEYVGLHKKPRSAQEDRRHLRLYVLPALRQRLLKDVRREDIAKLHHSLAATPVTANRVLQLLSAMFNRAIEWGVIPEGANPCRRVKRYREQRRERFLSEAELARLGEALSLAEQDGSASPAAVAAIRLLILTGARLSEILTLEWHFIDLERAAIFLPDSKTGQKPIYLGAVAELVGMRVA